MTNTRGILNLVLMITAIAAAIASICAIVLFRDELKRFFTNLRLQHIGKRKTDEYADLEDAEFVI